MLHCTGLIVKTPDRFIGISMSDCEISAKLYNSFISSLLFNVTCVSSHETRHFLSIVQRSIIELFESEHNEPIHENKQISLDITKFILLML